MNREQAIKIANDMAVFGTIWIDDQGNEVNDLVKFAQMCFEKGRQQGMKQEQALQKLAETSNAIGWDL